LHSHRVRSLARSDNDFLRSVCIAHMREPQLTPLQNMALSIRAGVGLIGDRAGKIPLIVARETYVEKVAKGDETKSLRALHERDKQRAERCYPRHIVRDWPALARSLGRCSASHGTVSE